MIRRRLLALITGLLALMLTLSACSPLLPTDGPVGTSAPESGEERTYTPQAQPPQTGASAEQIVSGFIRAGAGAQDDYAVAREFMSPEAARDWRPDARTVVYSAEHQVLASGENTWSAQFQVDSVVDGAGILTRLPENSTEVLDFTVEEIEGEWRITDAPDGTMLNDGSFQQAYQAHTLYYFDPQLRYAVPDQRWFLNRPGISSEIVGALLAGPAPYLEPAVVSAFGEDVMLERASVPVDNSTAAVDLAPEGVEDADPAERALMQEQLELALTSLTRINEVEITVAQRELEIPVASDLPEEDRLRIEVAPEVDSTQVGIENDTLRWQNDQVTLSIGSLPDIADLDPQAPALPGSFSEDVFAFLNGEGDQLYHLRPERAEDLVLEAPDLTRPSMDNYGWTWTASAQGDEATVHSLAYDESLEPATAEVSADWLEGRTITSLRIAQDGARAALILDDDGERDLYVAGVIRDSSGIPRGLGQPMRLETSVKLEEVRWQGPDALYVWANSEEEPMTPERVTLTGSNRVDSPLLGLLNISVGEGQQRVFAETVDVPFQNLSVDAWVASEDIEIRDLAFPG
ncbi:GerMN domain-containing protein [Nesterenkonia sp. E16_7]|uniref:LpqB family beta-propeller domain-containing protein n=1 Tax=unclassified Nesterenkonia TaxID=2629769 RepID=UPI001A91097D|nr:MULTISPECIES: LpqB family beta-propeller domain-containing protein [unclassified Nesterenkonia]MBO0594326.1 GerMN domain-containing protein [Nesterenkonia sp. E16_10]MBO0598464.1 GerMN domain-containing protein [Nesterenkonia sp. E16_7]